MVYWQTHKKRIIREKLESAIEKKSGGFYTIKYDNLELDEVTGYLSITNLNLVYDSLKYEGLRQLNMAPSTLLKLTVPEITIEGVKTPKALLSNEIDGRKLLIKNPSIEIIYTMQGKDSARNMPSKEVYEQILGNLNQISLDTVLLSGATITTRNLKTKQRETELHNTSIQLLDVKVDSAANVDPSRLLFSKQVSASCENISWLSENKLYKYKLENLGISSAERIVHAGSFEIQPQLAEDAFVKHLPAQGDRFDFDAKDISITGLDIPQLLNEEITADAMTIGSGTFKVYRDLNIPRDKKNRVGSYPHQAVQDIPFPVYLKKIIVNHSFLEYKEMNNITHKAGKVQFHDINAVLTNFTNKKELLAKNNQMAVETSCRFMDLAPFKTSWLFYLEDDKGRFNIKANLGGFDATALNQLTEPMGPARIEKGMIKGGSFNFDGDNYGINGTLTLLYDNLKVALLEKDKGAREWDKKSLTSFFANMLVKNSNPKDDDEEPKTVTINYERDSNRSLFNLCWKALFKGIQQTVGIKK